MPFTLAIIGRPNVGKSTLYNKIAGRKLAIVDDRPGVTRDWRTAEVDFMGEEFTIIDTAGLEESFDDTMEGRMRQQTEDAISHADAILFMIDMRAGITPMDQHFAAWARRQKLPIVLVANKCENIKVEESIYEAYELGMGDPVAVSAEHAMGYYDLIDALKPMLEKYKLDNPIDEEEEGEGFEKIMYAEGDGKGFGDLEYEEDLSKPIKLAIVGRPNGGKSTLLNALVGSHRVMTGPEPGVTRDSITVDWVFDDRKFKLVDTAGIRKRAKVIDILEKTAVDDSLRAIRLAQVVILVLDANLSLEKQDLTIAAQVIEEGRALVIAMNKWDDTPAKNLVLRKLQDRLIRSLPQIKAVPTVTISALKEQNLDVLMQTVLDNYATWNKRVPTGKLNRWLRLMEDHHPAPLAQGKANRLRYMTQTKARPPTFALWVSKPKDIADSYKRYLENGLREDFDIPGVPIRLLLRTTNNPYHD